MKHTKTTTPDSVRIATSAAMQATLAALEEMEKFGLDDTHDFDNLAKALVLTTDAFLAVSGQK